MILRYSMDGGFSITNNDGTNVDMLVTKVSFELDAENMVPMVTLEVIPDQVVITVDDGLINTVRSKVICNNVDLNGTPFTVQPVVNSGNSVFCRNTEESS